MLARREILLGENFVLAENRLAELAGRFLFLVLCILPFLSSYLLSMPAP